MKLYPYQERAVEHVLAHKRCALWLEMGLGKSAVTLTALKNLPKPAIVLAPKRVVDHVWEQEAAKWSPRAKVVVLTGTPAQRAAKLRLKADIYVINFELVPWLIGETSWWWPTVVIDEATRVKNRASKLFKALRKVAGKWQHLIELTGSPAPNGLVDLWGQLYLIDRGDRLGKTLTAFRDRWFDSDYMGWSYTPKAHAQQEIEERCSDVCLSMTADDYLNLPDKMIQDVHIDLPAQAAKEYKHLKDHMLAEIDGEMITAMTAAVLANKLLQLTSGALYDEDGAVVSSHDAKLEAIDDVLSTIGNETCIIVYQFRHELDRLRKKFGGTEVRDYAEAVDDWNKGKIKLLYIHPASAGLGLNLQHGGRHMIWSTPTWNLEHYQQTNARLYRTGQTKPVMIYRILTSNTIDLRVVEALGSKDAVQTALMNALK